MGDDDDFEGLISEARSALSSAQDGSDLWEANELLGRALSVKPASADAWLLKAQVLSALSDPAAALACAEMALRRAPRSAEAHYWIAAGYADLERFQDALRSVDRAFRHASGDTDWLMEDLYHEKAMILQALGQADAALAVLEAGLERYPGSSLLLHGLEPLRKDRARRQLRVIPGGRA